MSDLKYSLTYFEEYTYRFTVEFKLIDGRVAEKDIYSNSNSFDKLKKFLYDKRTYLSLSESILRVRSKEEDDLDKEIIDLVLGEF